MMRGMMVLMLMTALVALSAEEKEGSYRLVWADEFNKDGPLDPTSWTWETGFVRNHELQWYQAGNAFCKGGCLILEARRERKPNPKFNASAKDWTTSREFIEYTSACVTTAGRHAWQYGRFEVRARIRTENGLWPAIWFLGVEGEWPGNGEIDLMEYYQNQLLANACWGTEKRHQAKWNSSKKPLQSFADPQWDQKFHIWRMDWDRESIKLYVDDLLLNTVDLSQAINPPNFTLRNPFQQPQYLLLDLAIGGAGGDPSKTAFPARYEIDYVRVYQKASETAQQSGKIPQR